MKRTILKENVKLPVLFLKFLTCLLTVLFLNIKLYGAETRVIITEFLAINNSILSDQDGDFSDWIEVYNTSAELVNLKDWVLTDNDNDFSKWKFPDINIASGEYLIVFASGKNLVGDKDNLHTNFKLSSGGEYLAIIDPLGQIVNSFSPAYPIQYPDISYGIINNTKDYFSTPTPGAENNPNSYVLPPTFSVNHGFYEAPFNLTLSSFAVNTAIKYTLDGSEPDLTNGEIFNSAFEIDSTRVVRAVAIKDGLKSICVTMSYIFVDDIINQTNTPNGYPSFWGVYSGENAIADYEMDPEITISDVQVKNSLLSISTISLVTDKDNLFSAENNPVTGGIYMRTNEDWERPASAEYFGTNDREGFQINCGIKIQGGQSRLPEKSPKHSIRLLFKNDYGPNKLKYNIFTDGNAKKEFNSIVLRAGYNNTWFHFDNQQRKRAQYIRDSWAKDTYNRMGCTTTNNKFVHLYLNGIYWGLYNLSERLDEDFMESYLGGDKDAYDVIKDKIPTNGNAVIWNQMMQYVSKGFPDNASYQFIQGKNEDGTVNPSLKKYLDVENLIDYMILNIYGGNLDWDNHNWIAARSKVDTPKGFQFFAWDTERILENVNENITDVFNENCPSQIFQQLATNTEFQLKFGDRIHQHFFNNGALTPEIAALNWTLRANEIIDAIIAESARWGDYRRDVHPWMNGPYQLYTVEDYWLTEQERLIENYFPDRTQKVLNQFINKGLYPTLEAPEFSHYGGQVPQGFELNIYASKGEIYYTIDNSDPRLPGGEISSLAILSNTDPLIIKSNTPIKARAKNGNQWSAITEALFETGFSTNINSEFVNVSTTNYSYPNPFHDYTSIYYYLPQESNVTICIYTLEGKLIDKFKTGNQLPGKNEVIWHPKTMQRGFYLYIIKAANYSVSGRMIQY